MEGGTDKGPDGYRPDTMPMVEALQQRGQDAEVLFFDITKSRKSFTMLRNMVLPMYLALTQATYSMRKSTLLCYESYAKSAL